MHSLNGSVVLEYALTRGDAAAIQDVFRTFSRQAIEKKSQTRHLSTQLASSYEETSKLFREVLSFISNHEFQAAQVPQTHASSSLHLSEIAVPSTSRRQARPLQPIPSEKK